MSKAYWIAQNGKTEIIDIGLETHISYITKHPNKFNLSLDEIKSLYDHYEEILNVEGKARKLIILGLIKEKNFIRVRLYRNFWSISINQLDEKSKSSLSQWAELVMTIPNSGKYADCIIQTIDGKKHHYSVQDLYSQSY